MPQRASGELSDIAAAASPVVRARGVTKRYRSKLAVDGLDVDIGHGITGFPGQAVSFAVRPEKLDIGKTEPAQPHNKARGSIEDIAYFGSHSVYHVRLPSGQKVLANFANSQRWASERFTWNDEVWLSWGDNAGVVLTA